MDELIEGVVGLINSITNLLPNWSFSHDVTQDVATLAPYFDTANVLVPMDIALQIFGLCIGLELLLISLYWIDRVINLIRGAG